MHHNPVELAIKNLTSFTNLIRDFVELTVGGSGLVLMGDQVLNGATAPEGEPERSNSEVASRFAKAVSSKIETGFERHLRFLCTAGLELHYAKENTAATPDRLPKPTISVCDGERVAEFLEGLSLLPLTEEDRTNVARLVLAIDPQFRALCEGQSPTPESRELLESFPRIATAYEQLGFAGKAEDIRESLEYYEKSAYGALIASRNLRERVGCFGPAEWHKDSSVETYEGNWKILLDYYRQISDCGAAWELRSDSYMRLAMEAATAVETLEKICGETESPRSEYLAGIRANAPEYLRITRAAQVELERIRSDE